MHRRQEVFRVVTLHCRRALLSEIRKLHTCPDITHVARRSPTLKALIGRLNPLSVSSPAGSNSANGSTAEYTLGSIRIWPASACAQSRAARFTTVPMAEYSKRP